MICASSSADHFDCFFAGDSAVYSGCGLFGGGGPAVDPEAEVTVLGPAAGRDADLEDADGDSSSSFGFNKSEISTLPFMCDLGTNGCLGTQSMYARLDDSGNEQGLGGLLDNGLL